MGPPPDPRMGGGPGPIPLYEFLPRIAVSEAERPATTGTTDRSQVGPARWGGRSVQLIHTPKPISRGFALDVTARFTDLILNLGDRRARSAWWRVHSDEAPRATRR
jgi:hypothetical protein